MTYTSVHYVDVLFWRYPQSTIVAFIIELHLRKMVGTYWSLQLLTPNSASELTVSDMPEKKESVLKHVDLVRSYLLLFLIVSVSTSAAIGGLKHPPV